MGGLPKKAIRKSNLIIKTVGSAVDDGSHKICKASFIENGVQIDGFYKELSPQKDYPELLAKISVAISLFKRLFQGKRSAEERLVFDDQDKLVGTISFNVPGFKPFNFINEAIPAQANAKELVIPSTKTLIENNIMEILLGRWFLDDDDGHPHNMSLAGDIDFDMFMYWFTIHIKNPRTLIGIPKTRVDLTVADWEHFPNVKDSKPYHWPPYKHPGQETIPSVIPGQGQILTRVLPKPYADPVQFENLAGDPEAQEQKFAAALKALLTYQPDMMRRRLAELFGDLTLNYTSLDATSVELRDTYEKAFPQLCNEKTNAEPFIDFIMKMYQEHYDNLYRVVVFYMGTDNNGYGVPLQATCNALYGKPSFYRNIEAWVKAQNEMMPSTGKEETLKEEALLKFDLPELQKRYHQVWRDAFAPYLKELLHDSYNLTKKVLLKVSSEADVTKLEATELLGKKTNDATLTNAWELFGKVPELSRDKVEPLIHVDKENGLREALFLLLEFTSKFNAAAKKYYEKERKDLTEDDNLLFSKQLSELYSDYNLKIRTQISQGLAHTSTLGTEFNRIANSLKQFTEQANFQLHLTTCDEQMKDTAKATFNKETLPLTNDGVMKQYNTCLFHWAKGLTSETFNRYVTEIIDKYYAPTLSLISTRHRAKPVKDYLFNSSNQTNDNRLAYILCSASEETGALNTLLIQHLTPYMMQTQHLPSIKNAAKDGGFYTSTNLDLYTKSAVAFASNDKQFNHLYNVECMKLFFQTMYAWVENCSSAKFKGIMESALKEYEGEKSMWTTSRRDEIKGYYKYTSQAKIVAFTFQNGRDASSLNEKLYNKIIDEMKKEIEKDAGKQEHPGNKLILQYNKTEHQTSYLKLLKTYAVEPSQKPEPVSAVAFSH